MAWVEVVPGHDRAGMLQIEVATWELALELRLGGGVVVQEHEPALVPLVEAGHGRQVVGEIKDVDAALGVGVRCGIAVMGRDVVNLVAPWGYVAEGGPGGPGGAEAVAAVSVIDHIDGVLHGGVLLRVCGRVGWGRCGLALGFVL